MLFAQATATLTGQALNTSVGHTILISEFRFRGPAGASDEFVEIYNNGNVPVNIGNWTIEYGSATGNWGSSAANIFTFPPNTIIKSCSWILVALGTASANPAVPPVPSPDFSNTTTNMSASNGKIGLFNASNPNVLCGSEAAGTLIDKVGYGTGSAICPEVAATGALTTTTGAVRNGTGMQDTDNNSADFATVTNPVPHNAASPKNAVCAVTPTRTSTWGNVKSIYR